MPEFQGKRVLVTGAAGGLGRAFVEVFAAAGATVILADIEAEGMARVASEVAPGAACITYDQGDLASIGMLAETVGQVDVLLNNAAILLVKPVLDTTPEEMARILQVNLLGPMALARAVATGMIARGTGGVILNMSSQLAFCGAEGRAVYAVAKAGLTQFTQTTAVEWAPQGVRVVGIAPGRINTSMTTFLRGDAAQQAAGIARVPAGRYGTPAEIARIVQFLCSPAADYVVGHTLLADGGYVLG
ncbi:SDR family oxidoreductase [Sediminicoccus sp. KRV36]|uniref:SDR family NAD(P)-dependent oxidoreductase n=1 Tax=Sediminicoccus sp. KRV36 TaxID=3133721 RepID=UPI00200CA682|nr:SDR family oxidoreductase [Sediminicoccus rosea]UPY38746.1 SDR family oxidoreductase [Sediminicoccus rosea]